MVDLSSAKGSLRKRAPSVSSPAQPAPPPVFAAGLKPSDLKKLEAPRKGSADLLSSIIELDRTPSRVSMSDVQYEEALKPAISPRAQRLDGLINEARAAIVEPPNKVCVELRFVSFI